MTENVLPTTPEEKAAVRFLLTTIFTGLMLHRSGGIHPAGTGSMSTKTLSESVVDTAQNCADEILKRVPNE